MRSLLAAAGMVVAALGQLQAQQPAMNAEDETRGLFIRDCVSRGSTGGDTVQTQRFCACAFDVVADGMTLREFLQLEAAGREKRDVEVLPQFLRLARNSWSANRKPSPSTTPCHPHSTGIAVVESGNGCRWSCWLTDRG
jgi:hypothetical protein